MLLEGKKYHFWVCRFLLTCLRNLKDIENSRQNRSKNKLVRENAVTREWKLFAPYYGLLEQYILSFRSSDTRRLALGIHIKSEQKFKIVSPARFLFHPIWPRYDTKISLLPGTAAAP